MRTSLAGVALTVLFVAVPAEAEIVHFTNGRTIVVDAYRFEGDAVVLTLSGGGEIRVGRALVNAFLPDEVPRARLPVGNVEEALVPAGGPPMDGSAIRRLVDEVAARVGVDRKLAHAIVHAESNYEPRAVSPRGAMGLMQIMPALARHHGLEDPFDPRHNLEAGMRHLSGLLRRFDVRNALAAYNAGEAAVSRYGGVPPFRETEHYVRRILAALR